MIGWLHGQVLHHHKDGAIVLDVHDVGYEVNVASQEDYRVGDVVDLCTSSPPSATTRSSSTDSRATWTASSSNCCWSPRE